MTLPKDSITTIRQFVVAADKATNDEIFNMFEEGPCTEELRDQLYALSAFAFPDSPEPFRAVMDYLGFPNY